MTQNVYAKIVQKYNLKEKLKPGEVLYGEIYGDGIQKNYSYGCGVGEQKLAAFDLMRDGEYVDAFELNRILDSKGIPSVPSLYNFFFDPDKIKALLSKPSTVCPEQKVMEGVVIKPLKEEKTFMGRKILKLINDEYLLQNNSDYH